MNLSKNCLSQLMYPKILSIKAMILKLLVKESENLGDKEHVHGMSKI